MPRRRRRSPRRRRLFALIAVILGAAIALLVGEFGMRIYMTWRTWGNIREVSTEPIRDPNYDLGLGDVVQPVADPLLIYRLKPRTLGRFIGQPLEINAEGFRGPLPQPAAPGERLFRIVSLGDSHAFGWGVPGDAPYSAQLRAALNVAATSGTRFEVLNLGVPGYNSVQEAELFKTFGAGYHPDLVLIQYCLNDTVLPTFLTKRDYLTNWSHLYLLDLSRTLRHFILREGPDEGGLVQLEIHTKMLPGQPLEMDPLDAPDEYLPLIGWDHLVEAYTRLKAECDAAGTPLYLVLPAELGWESFRWGQHDPRRDPHYDKIRALAAQLGIPVIDSFPDVFDFARAHDFHSLDLVVPNDGHPNAMKHGIIAQDILRAIGPRLAAADFATSAGLDTALASLRAANQTRAAAHTPLPFTPTPESQLQD